MSNKKTYVVKRDGRHEDVMFDKIKYRIKNICALEDDISLIKSNDNNLNKNFKPLKNVDYDLIAKETIHGLQPGITTSNLDLSAASIAQPMVTDHPEYEILASRLLISNYHKNTVTNLYNNFKNYNPNLTVKEVEENLLLYTFRALYENVDVKNKQYPLIDPRIYKIVINNHDLLKDLIDYSKDYDYDCAGFKLLEDTYLQKCYMLNKDGNKIRTPIERPQHLILRVALGIHCSSEFQDFDKMRYNDVAIFNNIADIIKKYFTDKNFKKYKIKAYKKTIDWNEVITIVQDNTPVEIFEVEFSTSKDPVELIRQEIAKNTISWSELLNNFDGKITQKQLVEIKETIEFMSNRYFIHATPTLFNAGTLRPQCSSCYLVKLPFDSLKGINSFWKKTSTITKYAGGVGYNTHDIRGKDSYIRGTNGVSNGIIPFQKVENDIAVYIDQGGGKRMGAMASYLEPHHCDIESFIYLKLKRGNEYERARNLLYAIWLNDEFFRTIEYENSIDLIKRKTLANDLKGLTDLEKQKILANNKCRLWYLMSSDVSENLSNLYDAKFTTKWIQDKDLFDPKKEAYMKKNFAFTYTYRKYIKEGKYSRQISATELWEQICEIIGETGVPYLCFKDCANRKNNQKNLGTIKSSNLCTEIYQFSSSDQTSVCNLTSNNLAANLTEKKPDNNWLLDKVVIKKEDMSETLQNFYYNGFATNFDYLMQKSEDKKIKYMDFNLFEKVTRRECRNLNKIIDINFYPTKCSKYSNLLNRPLGMGVQNFARLFTMLRLPFDSAEALEINYYLFEFRHYIALDESCNLSIEHRKEQINNLTEWLNINKKLKPTKELENLIKEKEQLLEYYTNTTWSGAYKTFKGSPASRGELQLDLFVKEQLDVKDEVYKGKTDVLPYKLSLPWDELKQKIITYGLRNSLVDALMPTGSTSTILKSTPCFEPINGVIMKRRDKVGEHLKVESELLNDLIEHNLWNEQIKNQCFLDSKGSISNITKIPKIIRDVYKTVWDIDPIKTSKMCITRSPFIDQGQSYTIFMDKPTINKLTQFHFYNWRRGLKTSSYYTRRLAAVDAKKIQVTPENSITQNNESTNNLPNFESVVEGEVCTMKEGCLQCGS